MHVPDQNSNQNVILGSCAEGKGELKLYTAKDLDQIHSFDKENT